ncbi:galactocerebrosidase-like [Mya arenaria]|uniref:galactocerebrosidase-like n=1 Tax=Mya arenaria TaxID=6604 RepID=UPI0022E64937|nr:galactocerebrosidase-like [Mya arenaria]
MELIFCLMLISLCHHCQASEYYIDDTSGLGRTFDGIGGLSGGGATSKLLVNYPEPQRTQILDFLFKPNFGASLQILKVEIGGDGQSTDGTEASHMHSSDDENYQRGYEWWLMVEAKKRNPDIKIYGLPWAFPGWLNKKGQSNPYTYPDVTAGYIISWIKGASKYYNITVDYVGIWNEKYYDKNYIKTLRAKLDKSGLTHVRIVAPDAPMVNDWKICVDILKDPVFAEAVDIVGCHYPGTLTSEVALQTGKPLWSSEDYSSFNDLTGGGCWARILNQNYVNGNITSTISWNLIAAYYDSLPYTRDGLMTAMSPWSGHYVVSSPIWMTAHTTQFTKIGWSYLHHGKGAGHLDLGGSYVTLTSQDRKQLTIVMETMTHDHSTCVRPKLPEYNVTKQDVTFVLKGSFVGIRTMQMWRSQFVAGTDNSVFFRREADVQVVNGRVKLSLNPDEVVTLTTVTTGNHGNYPAPPPSKDFPLPYTEDFERYNENEEPYNFAQQTGSFEVVMAGSHGNVMRQMVTQTPIYWCSAEKLDMAVNFIGSQNWSNIYVQTDARLVSNHSADGYFIAARINQGGCWLGASKGVFFHVYPQKQKFLVSQYIDKMTVLVEGYTGPIEALGWNTLRLMVNGNIATGGINNNSLFSVTIPTKNTHGFVGLGTSSWGYADFDNVHIEG